MKKIKKDKEEKIVYLVGAGPGDLGLVSKKALEYIESADIIIYDRLAEKELLKRARPGAELIDVGKASSKHTMSQEDINKLLVEKACGKEKKIVVRLKGGDPFVFGRGAEEALFLRENGIKFEIVPGITSAVSVPAYAGIPVTHRGIAASFSVITGHEDPFKEESAHKWDKLATATDTLVFLMGVENISHITSKLIENGLDASTPAALIRWGTKPFQKTLITTLKKASDDVKRENFKPPAVFVVGQVVKLRESLAWFDNKKLSQKNVLVTRAREQASYLTNLLTKLGANVIEFPAIKIVEPEDNFVSLDRAVDGLSLYDWIIFTSVNAVDSFFSRLYKKGYDARAIFKAKVAAIGVPTSLRIKEFGIIADIVPVEFRAEGIIDILAPLLKPGQNVLIPRAFEAREILPEKLGELGAKVDVVQAYRTVASGADKEELFNRLDSGEIDIITFTSSSTVTNLLKVFEDKDKEVLKGILSKAKIACIGPITAETCLKSGLNPDIIAKEYTIKGLVEAIESYY